MKKNISSLIAVLACGLFILSSAKTVRLEKEIDRLRSDLNNDVSNINYNISEIYNDVQEMLDEKANELAISEWEYGDIHIEGKTAEVVCTIVPKVYTPNVTEASIVCNNQEYAMTYSDEFFSAVIEVPLFDRSEINMVKLNDLGTIRIQEMEWIIEPRYEALLRTYSGMGGSAKGKPDKEGYLWSTQFSMSIHIEGNEKFKIQSIELVEILDGKEVNRTPIDTSSEGQAAYAVAIGKTKNAVPEAPADPTYFDGSMYEGHASFIYFLDKDYTIPNGSMLELYVDVVDGDGLRYRSFAECMAVSSDGMPNEQRMDEKKMYAFAESVMIFDEEGNVIYEINPELFK